ncbi:response regulator [Candidatus Thioglobus sp.]|jgi:FixJ family two-component response regulator|uniref:response regulator transcription factor n=1 Tax=Candidatus Thioglobus sp. TaxID=2026721 RepID=UPI001D40A167|nr:response regulator [Candidatus Thioglobus sp.]MBT3277409.1 response regulator transcription factor [Candidatus Thioglobus sp.]MBT3447231.1 response regulator transcription factor [Candidatus Thioglobus sp.]MBT3744847.1 response regulator transcription factor [Candidatus Thioglobus sp.]MBT4001629.1 response regulator transcription factor [Candidatus Thioglobus sp.]MBT4182287.1 response regulator transcription factor [Candidatus Thioglobus sp.]
MNKATVFIIDDDQQVRAALSLLMESVGWKVKLFATAVSFLEQFDSDIPGCIITDIRMPMMSGLDLQIKLKEYRISPPVLMITGHGDITMAVRAIKEGALDFIEKPFNNQYLLDRVHQAIEVDSDNRKAVLRVLKVNEKYNQLTDKEKQVFGWIIKGALSKQIAEEVFVTQSAVEARRSKIMEKMNADNISDLMKMAMVMGMVNT